MTQILLGPVISTAGAEIPYSSNDKNDAPGLSFRPKRRGVEKSHAPWYRVHGGRRFLGSESRESQSLPSCRQIPPLEMTYGPKSCHQKIGMEKGCEEMIGMSSRSFFVGEIPWGCKVMAHPGSFLPIPSHPCLWSMDSCKNKVLDRKKAFPYNKEER